MYIDELIREIAYRTGRNHKIWIKIKGVDYEFEIDNSEKDEVMLIPTKQAIDVE